MKRFLKFYARDKQNVKMINQSEKGFELIILSDKLINEFMETVHTCEENKDDIAIVWQMKFKRENYILYKNCIISPPMENFNPFARGADKEKPYGKKFKVTCSGTSYYTELKPKMVFNPYSRRSATPQNVKFNDIIQLERMLKIGELNLKSE